MIIPADRQALTTGRSGAADLFPELGGLVPRANVYRMLPSTLASAVRSLADLTPGRLTMTLGPWWQPLATKAGADRQSPLHAMADTTFIVRRACGRRLRELRRDS